MRYLPHVRYLRVPFSLCTILALLVGLGGCNSYPAGLVPVSGKLTLDGKPWTKIGQITFSSIKPVEGHPTLPAMSKIEEDGSFSIKTAVAPGLVPGEYGVAIQCWAEAPDEGHAGRSAVAARYRSVQTSGLKVTVPEGSKPIFLSGTEWDIKSK